MGWHILATPLVVGSAFPTAGCALRTLLEWRSAEVGRPEPPADGNGAWLGSCTTSPTNSGPRSKLLGVAARTAARRTSRCSATAYSHSPRGGRYTLDNVVPACPSCNTSKCNDEVTGWLRRKRLDERAFLLRHIEVRMAFGLHLRAEPDAALAPLETTQETLSGSSVSPIRPQA